MSKSMSCVALLPMKAHSQRVAGKNFRLFAGKPLFKWILDTLLNTKSVSSVVINTDARDLLESHGLVESERIIIRERKAGLRGDDVSMNRILEDDIDYIASDFYLMTHTTNPLLSSDTIERALETYRQAIAGNSGDSLFSVNRHQTRFYRKDGSPINHDPKNLIPTQDLESWYEENSNLYLFTESSFKKTGSRIGTNPILFETPRMESSDIDDMTEWRIAEVLALSKQLFDAQLQPET